MGLIMRNATDKEIASVHSYIRSISVDTIDYTPTIEYTEHITIKCDTEDDKQKILSALRNSKLFDSEKINDNSV